MKGSLHWPRDLSLRLLALLLAITLWFLAAEDRHITWLDAEEVVMTLPVHVEKVPSGLVLVGSLEPVVVRLRMPKGVPTEELKATVNASGRRAGEQHLPVYLSPLTQGSVLSIEPPYVELVLEQIKNETYTVEVAVLGVPAGMPLQVEAPEPASVTLSAGESVLSRVVRVVATIIYRTNTAENKAEVRPLDAAGHVVAGVSVKPQHVQVSWVPLSTDEESDDDVSVHETESENIATVP